MSPGPPSTRSLGAGRVVAFDDDAGLGEVESDDGARYSFHCTEIAGGTRTIAPGTKVHFLVGFGNGGRLEARAVTPR